MKKIVTVLIIAVMAVLMLPALTACTPRENTLRICNWEDYIAPEVLEGFKEYYKSVTGEDIVIEYEALSSNEEMLAQIAINQADYDLVCPSDYMIEKMRTQNLLLKLNKDLGNDTNGNPVENYMNSTSSFTKGRDFDPNNEYAVCYMWGTLGILYNTTLINEGDEITSWSSLWDSDYTGQILMKDSVRDSFCVAAIYANRNSLSTAKASMTPAEYNAYLTDIINDTDTEGMNLAKNALIAQKPFLKGYEVDTGKTDMMDGTATMSLQWAGDAVYSISENEDLAYVIPEEGSNVFFDGWVIPKYAVNTRAANLFINYICSPESAMANMDWIGYTSAVASSEIIDYLNENYADCPAIDLSYFFGQSGSSVHADPNMYPPTSVIANCAVMRDFGDAETAINEMWNTVKSS